MYLVDVLSNVPALIIIGAVAIPSAAYLLLGLGEGILTRFGLRNPQSIRPWVWLLVPLVLVGIILVYPLVATIGYSFLDAQGKNSVGSQNFVWAFQSEMLTVLGNNLIWLIAFPVVTLVLALMVAVLFDRVKYERLAMTLVLLPTAISFTAGSIIWRQIYTYGAPGTPQRGVLNALATLAGGQPVPWLQTPVVNTLALVFVAVWSSLGVAALILSAAVKNVPTELMEASRLDGAGEWRVFRSVILPSILPAVMVVVTTEVIFALKVFDIVYVMTNGNFNTNTVANRMYYELFAANNLGHASAIAVILLIVALPIVIINIRQFRAEEAKS
ncbi:carbohydrate ABC transporter permease [Pseudarthrobacter sp. LMD1-1-1.1]|uniref:carbohydrate ABC transporter permease n=1 Tax=Pseudarthrobacter sp. LMD1-1-1.1 TaxID=3135242 RepID=UPI00344856B9